MKQFILQVLCIFFFVQSEAQIRKAEYFIDSDPGFGNAIPVSLDRPSMDTTYSFTVPTVGLTPGLHRIFYRVYDSTQRTWSLSAPKLFYFGHSEGRNEPNIVKAEYFIDNDPGFGVATNIPVTSGTDVTFTFTPSTSGLSAGLHRLFVRTKDAKGGWSLSTPQLFYFGPSEGRNEPNIVKAEYFLDTDPGFGNGTNIPVTAGVDVTFSFSSATAGLTEGLHRLFVRTKDAKGNWSHSVPQLFFWGRSEGRNAPNIVKAEYFIDNDPGFGSGTDITITADQEITFTFNHATASLSDGLHRLYVRTKDAKGGWSITTPQLFYYEKAESRIAPNIVKAEYFFDTDPGFGNATPTSVVAGQDIVFSFNGDIDALANGLHRLFIRTLDINGNWSQTTPQLFYREKIENHIAGNLIKLEWFWDTDPGFGNGNAVSIPAGQTEITNLNFSVAAPGTFSNTKHNLFVRILDDWSLTTVTMVDFTNIVLPVTLIRFNAQAEENRVKTSWDVEDEINMLKYVVEHSSNGINFTAIGETPASGSTSYSLYHNDPVQGINYYRLRQVDIDGSFKYSPIITVHFSVGMSLLKIYPNPSTVNFKVEASQKVRSVELSDINGKVVKKYKVSTTYETSGIAAGTYLVRIIFEDGKVITKPIVINN